ncbi:MAG: MarR family winged helix-turn-helix transcriptional regulator [Bacillota bacterium]|jgi:DNA-binding MarR family transcriptional regulator
MSGQFARHLDDLLSETFTLVMKVEETTIETIEDLDLSISEIHLVEAIGRNKRQQKTISEIAAALDVTLPSVTVAINKLVKKGYVEKKRGAEDGRTVFVSLTRLGHKVDLAHSYFHAQMNRDIACGFTETEKEVMISAMSKLNRFLKQKLEEMTS